MNKAQSILLMLSQNAIKSLSITFTFTDKINKDQHLIVINCDFTYCIYKCEFLQESSPYAEDSTGQMVGQTSNPSETDGNEMLSEKDVSQYLSLHSYSAKPPESPRHSTKLKSPKKPKEILPKITTEEINNNELASYVTSDVVYGTYDEKTNLITIIVDDDNCFSEIVDNEVIIEDQESLCVPKTESGNTSPCSDYGYESYGSPGETSDVWDTSVSELFPNLL